jgi:hypothetical protein
MNRQDKILKAINRENITKIVAKCKDKETFYERSSYWGLFLAWGMWMFITVLGIFISVFQSVFVTDSPKWVNITVIVVGCVISGVGLIQQRMKPFKKGYLFKQAAAQVREISREATKLRSSKMTPDDVSIRLDELFEEIENIGLRLYSSHEVESEDGQELKRVTSINNIDGYSSRRYSVNMASPSNEARSRASSAPPVPIVVNDDTVLEIDDET